MMEVLSSKPPHALGGSGAFRARLLGKAVPHLGCGQCSLTSGVEGAAYAAKHGGDISPLPIHPFCPQIPAWPHLNPACALVSSGRMLWALVAEKSFIMSCCWDVLLQRGNTIQM